jgi:hypothetical protein
MMAGRNEPCPCGSGKKYKKCCLAKDQEASSRQTDATPPGTSSLALPRPVHAAARPAKPSEPPRPPDPVAERAESLFREFRSRTGEDRIAAFLEIMEDDEVMDDEMAFEMLTVLHSDAMEAGTRTRFAECIDALRERRPEVYDHEAHYYLSWRLKDALADGRQEVVPTLARELAALAGRDIDMFNRGSEALSYHGQLDILVEALRIAWPLVKSSDNVVPWGVSNFAERGFRHEIYDYLEHTAAPDPNDAVLLDRVRFFVENPREGYLPGFIGDLTGTSGREWQADDFALRPPRKRGRDEWDSEEEESPTPNQGAINLGRLISEFVGYLRREEGIPFSRGEMVRQELFRYFLRRNEGELDPSPSMLEQIAHPNRKLPKPPRPAHPLCPERVTLDVHLAGLMDFMSMQYYTGAALFQAMPAWLRFLESRGLIDAATSMKVMAALLPLHASLLRIWLQYTDDPILSRQGQAWPASP